MVFNPFSRLSLPTLVWFGFLVTTTPLLLSLVWPMQTLDELSRLGRLSVVRAVKMTQQSHMLMSSLPAMERSIRQYIVLEDEALRQAYENRHTEFTDSLEKLFSLSEVGDPIWTLTRKLASQEYELYRRLTTEKLSKQKKDSLAQFYDEFDATASEVWTQSAFLVNSELAELDKRSEQVKSRMLRVFAVLLPAYVILVFVFVYLIVRPIRQLDNAIRGLGSANFDRPIAVTGPKDLEYLGGRLDWLRKRLKELEAEKQRFLRNVSHELKTPLATIYEGVELLVDGVVGPLNDGQMKIGKKLQGSSQRLDKLIEDLINYSQVEAQKSVIHREPVDLAKMVRGLVREYQINCKAKEIRIRTHLEDVRLFANFKKIQTVVDNLLSNAVKYSPVRGVIHITVVERRGSVVLEIEDQGPGVPEAERARIFEVFFRGEMSQKGAVKGSGIGLSIVNECVALHQGNVKVLDPRYNETGARFQITLASDLRH